MAVDRGHISFQAAEGPCCLRALVREKGDHVPEVVHFLTKLLVLTDQPRDNRVKLAMLLGDLSQPVGQTERRMVRAETSD